VLTEIAFTVNVYDCTARLAVTPVPVFTVTGWILREYD